MKANDFLRFITKLHTLNQDAEVIFRYKTEKGLRFQELKEIDVDYNQKLENDKLITDQNTIIVDLIGKDE